MTVLSRFTRSKTIFALTGLLLTVAGACTVRAEGLIAPGATLEKLAGDFKFTEGPAADAQGNVYFTDQPNDRILKWSVDGKLSTFLESSGRANGLYFDRQGNLWAAADANNELWRISPDGKHTVVVKDFGGKLLNGPNDLWIRPDGGVYFTDPFYKRPYWQRGPMEQEQQAVYYVAAPDYKNVKRAADGLEQPNGIIGTPDGKTLYVADIKANKTYAYDIRPDGALENRRLFCALGSDGMTIDSQGNVYLTGKGVTVFDKTGKQVEQIAVPEGWTANVTFGGEDNKTLFITASKSLYGLKMAVSGGSASAANARPIRILPLGDSITQGGRKDREEYTYRYPLYWMLRDAGYTVDFIGSMNQGLQGDAVWPDRNGVAFDMDHEGHYGWKTAAVRDNLGKWMEGYAAPPDIVLIHLGTNDQSAPDHSVAVVEPLKAIVQMLRARNPNVVVLIGHLNFNYGQGPKIRPLVEKMAQEIGTAQSPVITVHHYQGWYEKPGEPQSDTYDWAHPNPQGQRKMAQKWMDAMKPYLDKLSGAAR